MALWDPSQLGSAFYAGFRVIDTAGANAGAEITQAAGTVSQWSDWSGNARHVTQGTGSRQPAYSATSFNTSYPGVTSDGTRLLGRALSPAMAANTLVQVFAATQYTTGAAGVARVVSFSVGGVSDYGATGGYIPLLTDGGPSGFTAYRNGFLSDAAVAINTPAIVASVSTSTQQQSWANGTAATAVSSSYTFAAADEFVLFDDAGHLAGSTNSGSGGYIGTIAEVVIVTGTISAADIDRVNGYLAWKYGLQGSLPTGHAYKSAAPTTSGGTTTGVGTSAGLGTATGVGASTGAAAGSSAGLGAATAGGARTVAGSGASAGVGAATGTGASSAAGQGAGTSAGISTVAATGAATKAAVGNVTGAATASGTAPVYQVLSAAGSSFGSGLAFGSPFVAIPVIIGDGNRLLTPLVTIDHDMFRYKSGAKASVNNSSARGRGTPARRPYAETWD